MLDEPADCAAGERGELGPRARWGVCSPRERCHIPCRASRDVDFFCKKLVTSTYDMYPQLQYRVQRRVQHAMATQGEAEREGYQLQQYSWLFA